MPNYRAMARRAARRHGLDPAIFERQIQQESGFAEDVITGRRASSAGAQGIAQIMPATARGWGVDPLNPKAALNAAAKNMARYVKQYGGYENALRAYNAGPGAIQASKGYAETNNYVKTILGGRTPSTKGVGTKAGGKGGKTPTRLAFNPAALNGAAVQALQAAAKPQRTISAPAAPAHSASATLPQGYATPEAGATTAQRDSQSLQDQLAAVLQTSPVNALTVGGKNKSGGKSKKSGAAKPGGRYDIAELFWEGPGAVNLKNNQPTTPVGGHGDHVHVAAGPKGVVALGKLAQQMGLSVRENPAFDPVDPVHVTGSYHYKNRAIDVSGDPQLMKKFARRVYRMRGG